MNGRTYCGHYRGNYLKSTLEYIYARYLDYMGVSWEYEVQTFYLPNGSSYKPDFCLSKTKFVEIKGNFNYETDKPKVELFAASFGYDVEILQEKDLRELIKPTPFVFEQLKKEWKNQATALGMDTTGKNNPRYGVTVSKETRKKIGDKSRLRMQDPEYRKKWHNEICKHSLSEENLARLKSMSAEKRKTVFQTCLQCNTVFEVLYNKSHPPTYCSYKCSSRHLFSKAAHTGTVLELAQEFALKNKDAILSCKLNRIKPVLDPFYKIVESVTGMKDVRTLTLYLVGKQSGNKEILLFFQSLTENVFGASVNNETEELEDKEPLG